MRAQIWLGILKGRNHSEELHTDNIKKNLRGMGFMVWIGFMWPRTETGDGFF
jgi:hypothetical protein